MAPRKKSKVTPSKPKPTEDDEDIETESEAEEEDDEDLGRGKRKRRESQNYEPDDFTMPSVNTSVDQATVSKGRGVKLGDIAAVKASINKYKLGTDELLNAYKFVFSNRGTSNKKLMKEKLLEFSGYLPPLPKGKYNAKKIDKEDEVYETKYATKAFKMTVNQIKTLCIFFGIDYGDDDGKTLKKDDMIDRLLDFLGEPNDSYIKVDKGPPVSKKKAPVQFKKVVTKIVEAPIDPFSSLKDYKKGKSPSDKVLRQWVRAYIVCTDMETATTKDAVRTASAKFGVDMTGKKNRIKQLLAEEL